MLSFTLAIPKSPALLCQVGQPNVRELQSCSFPILFPNSTENVRDSQLLFMDVKIKVPTTEGPLLIACHTNPRPAQVTAALNGQTRKNTSIHLLRETKSFSLLTHILDGKNKTKQTK